MLPSYDMTQYWMYLLIRSLPFLFNLLSISILVVFSASSQSLSNTLFALCCASNSFSSSISFRLRVFNWNTEDDSQNELTGFSELHRPLWPDTFEHFLLCLHARVVPPGTTMLDFKLCHVANLWAFLYMLFCAFRRLNSVIWLKERFIFDVGFGKRQWVA